MLQGTGKARGRLIGGCAEVLEMIKGTAWWPRPETWDGAIFFYETSEGSPDPDLVRYWLRNYAATGILARLSGILLARPDPGADPDYRQKLEAVFRHVLAEEGFTDLPVISGLDFGHTQSMLVLPYGVLSEIDADAGSLSILEAGVGS